MKVEVRNLTLDNDTVSYKEAGSSCHGYYIFCNATVFAELWIDGEKLDEFTYQNGVCFDYNDYSCPSNEFYPNFNGFLAEFWDRVNKDWDEWAEKFEEEYGRKFSAEDLAMIYEAMSNARPRLDELGLSDDADDYDIVEESETEMGSITRKAY